MAPRIFTLLRSPVTGTSGGQPTRLQVACRVESCRKLASSVKISAQCRAWAFFKVRIDPAAPAVLRRDIGAGQNAPWTLHRKSPGRKQLAHMTGVILDAELLLDHPGNHGRRPDAVVQTISHRTAVQNISQLLLLLFRQLRWSTRPVAFQQTVHSIRLIVLEPLRHLRPRCLQNPRQLAAGLAFRVQHDRLQSFSHTIGSVPFRFLAEPYQTLIRARVQSQQSRKHGQLPPKSSMPHSRTYVPLLMRACIAAGLFVLFGSAYSQIAPRSVSLSWTASASPNVRRYKIYRGTASGGPYRLLTSPPVVGTSYIDTAVQAGTIYYYVVSALGDGNDESAYSNEAQAVIPAA